MADAQLSSFQRCLYLIQPRASYRTSFTLQNTPRKNLSHEWQTTLPTKTGLNSHSQSTYVWKRGLVHRARNREDKGSGLWVSAWFALLSGHPPPGRRENGSRQGPGDIHFCSCICNKTIGVFFCKSFYTLVSKSSPPLTHQLKLHYQSKGIFHSMHLCLLYASGMIWGIWTSPLTQYLKTRIIFITKAPTKIKGLPKYRPLQFTIEMNQWWKNHLTPAHITEMDLRNTVQLLLITA